MAYEGRRELRKSFFGRIFNFTLFPFKAHIQYFEALNKPSIIFRALESTL